MSFNYSFSNNLTVSGKNAENFKHDYNAYNYAQLEKACEKLGVAFENYSYEDGSFEVYPCYKKLSEFNELGYTNPQNILDEYAEVFNYVDNGQKFVINAENNEPVEFVI